MEQANLQEKTQLTPDVYYKSLLEDYGDDFSPQLIALKHEMDEHEARLFLEGFARDIESQANSQEDDEPIDGQSEALKRICALVYMGQIEIEGKMLLGITDHPIIRFWEDIEQSLRKSY